MGLIARCSRVLAPVNRSARQSRQSDAACVGSPAPLRFAEHRFDGAARGSGLAAASAGCTRWRDRRLAIAMGGGRRGHASATAPLLVGQFGVKT